MDCSLLWSSIHGVFQARVLEWVAISFSRGSSWPGDRSWVSRIVGRHCGFTVWATREVRRCITVNVFQSRNQNIRGQKILCIMKYLNVSNGQMYTQRTTLYSWTTNIIFCPLLFIHASTCFAESCRVPAMVGDGGQVVNKTIVGSALQELLVQWGAQMLRQHQVWCSLRTRR